MYKAKVNIKLRKSILDPKGKATRHALHNLGLNDISEVRIGKLIELDLKTESESEALKMAESACARLLANEVMEDYHIELEKG
ncbi:MAG: phosphoribosylformylglycinamidine synthase subunit PurS [Balneolaceae bacterium]